MLDNIPRSLVSDRLDGRECPLLVPGPILIFRRYVQPPGTDQLPSVSTILTRTVQKSYTCEDLKANVKSPPGVQIYPVPYSEHSSFYELTCFAMSFNWKKMIATVNVGSEKSRAKMARWVAKWEAERKRRGKTEIIEHRHAEYW